LLIDNGSSDSAGILLAAEFSGLKCLRLAGNQGFAGGFNAGIKHCLQHGAEWIWLLNNDTVVAPDSLSILVSEALKNPQAAVFGATVHSNDDVTVTSGPGQIDFWRAKTYLRPLNKTNGNSAIPSEWLSGSNMLVHSTALTDNYVFDPDYFLYFEDTEFCTRMRKHGWECLFIPAAYIHHEGNASTSGELSYWRAYYYTRNRLLFFGKALGVLKAVPAFVSIFAHLLRHLLVLPFRGTKGRKQLKAEYLGLRDYLLGRFGKATCLDWAN
jgi:GT2 family glycosyltransferase